MDKVIKKISINDINVQDLIAALQDCRPDAEIYVSYQGSQDELRKIKGIVNGGNYVQIFYSM